MSLNNATMIDGKSVCDIQGEYVLKQRAKAERSRKRREKIEAMESLGLVRGKDSMGRTIWE